MLIYTHIPFCHRVCPYCSFYKHTPGSTHLPSFIEALITEAKIKIPQLPEPPRTLYFGGGTPSMLSPKHLQRLFTELHQIIDFQTLDEVTFEANPATFDLSKAKLFRDLGISRVSLGIQSFSASVLQTLGREHTPEQAIRAVEILHEAGIPQINIDLMFSVPMQTPDDWLNTLHQTIALHPHHISAYNLTYEEDTAFFESLRRGDYTPSEDQDADLFEMADNILTQAGFEHYETSNYARPHCQSSHNHGYWLGEDYLGLGPSAVTTINSTRSKNIENTDEYIQRIQSIGNAIIEAETLTPEQSRIERIALGLRTTTGIPLSLTHPSQQTYIQTLIDEGLAKIENDHLILIKNGRALVDPIAFDFID